MPGSQIFTEFRLKSSIKPMESVRYFFRKAILKIILVSYCMNLLSFTAGHLVYLRSWPAVWYHNYWAMRIPYTSLTKETSNTFNRLIETYTRIFSVFRLVAATRGYTLLYFDCTKQPLIEKSRARSSRCCGLVSAHCVLLTGRRSTSASCCHIHNLRKQINKYKIQNTNTNTTIRHQPVVHCAPFKMAAAGILNEL